MDAFCSKGKEEWKNVNRTARLSASQKFEFEVFFGAIIDT